MKTLPIEFYITEVGSIYKRNQLRGSTMFFTSQTLAAEEIKELTDLLYNYNTKRKSKAGSFRFSGLAREPARTIDIGDAYCNE